MPAVKHTLLFFLLLVLVAPAATKEAFDKRIAGLLKQDFPDSQLIVVSSNLNEHQQKLVDSINDLDLIELVNNNNKVIASHSNLLVRFRSEERIEFVKIPANISVLQKVWLTRRDVSRKEPINNSDLYQEELDILELSGKPFVPGSGRYLYTANLAKDSVLTTWKVTRAFDIIKSDKITAEVFSDGVELRIIVTALQSGFIGDRILVKFPSGKKLRGRVIDMQTVKVKL